MQRIVVWNVGKYESFIQVGLRSRIGLGGRGKLR